jgi:Tfp pilus assembly protein FimV
MATADPGDVADSYQIAEYEVRAGDNLWNIAGQHTSEGRDVRNTIEAIKRINHLDSSTIHPGQVLEIPLISSS